VSQTPADPVDGACAERAARRESFGRGAEHSTWLRELGFVDVHTVPFDAPGANGAVIGRKP
jgi:hypothetical protein